MCTTMNREDKMNTMHSDMEWIIPKQELLIEQLNDRANQAEERVAQLEREIEDLNKFREYMEDLSIETNDRLFAIENGIFINTMELDAAYFAGYDDGVKDMIRRTNRVR